MRKPLEVALLTLNRPEKLNSINDALSAELQHALGVCAADDTIRAVILTGAGRSFCAGQDLGEPLNMEKGIADIVREKYNPIVLGIRNLSKPVIGVINGVTAGAGTNLALSCDIVLAARSATLTQGFSKIGLVPDCGGTFTLPRLVGLAQASALMLLSTRISADEAQAMNMIYKVYEDEELQSSALEMAQYLATQPTQALAMTKQLLNGTFHQSLKGQLEQEAIWQEKAAATEDFVEGVKAFQEKRKAVFTGK